MDIVNTIITFEDTFSGAITTRTTTLSKQTFDKVKVSDIGKIVSYFDKVQQIRYSFKITKIEQAN